MIRAWIVAFCLWALPSHATVLDPLLFTSLGVLNPTGAVSINTDTLQLTGGASFNGVLDPISGDAVFTFENVTGGDISVTGVRSLALLSKSNAMLGGTIGLLGSGGLEIGAAGSLAMSNLFSLFAVGSGGDIQLYANHISLAGSINALDRTIRMGSATGIEGLGGTGGVIFPGGTIPILNTEPITPVPVPASLLLFATGLAVLGVMMRRKV
jgi:hypothetical protein